MLNEIKEHSVRPRTGRAYYQGAGDKQSVTRGLIRSSVNDLRRCEEKRAAAIARCNGTPAPYRVGTISGAVHAWDSDKYHQAGVANISIIAGSAEQAAELWRLWTEGQLTENDLDPVPPVEQSWWPRLLITTSRRLSAAYETAIGAAADLR